MNSQPGDELRQEATSGPAKAAPKRPRPAPVGPNGQPLAVREGSHGRGLVIGLALVIGLGGWILWNAARAATETPDKVKLGTDTVQVSRDYVELGKRIDRDGPRLYPGLAGTQADFWLTHVNNKFFAFAARRADTGRECNAVWRPELGQFEDGCLPGKLYGPTGEGLPPYDAFVEGEVPGSGSLYVRFKPPTP